MGIQQIPDQIKKAPTLGLRAVFSGIGRILMAADRPQSGTDASTGTTADRRRTASRRSRAAVPPEPANRFRSLDQTGNVRLLTPDDIDDEDPQPPGDGANAASSGAASQIAPAVAARTKTASEERATGRGAAAATPEPAASASLPLPGYDSLPLASIRARLRGLDVAQLRVLLEYESRNAERPEVIGMFERRIEKLETGS
jgi:hypothetical protein